MSSTDVDAITALRFYKAGDVRLERIQPLPCGPDDVRLKIAYCGICGTDLSEYLAGPISPPAQDTKHPFTGVSLPITMGHEFSGTVIELGPDVRGFEVGQAVAVNPLCDHRYYGGDPCTSCRAGRFNVCDATATYGLNAPGGGFCQETVVRATSCLPLPSNVSLKAAALVEPLAVAQHCISASGFQRGQTVLICGAGPIGLALLCILKVSGASRVIVTEVLKTRQQRAADLGADVVMNPLDEAQSATSRGVDPTLAALKQVVKDGVDVSFDATGLQSTLDLAIASTRPGGTVFNVAIHKKAISLHLNLLTLKEKKLMGGYCYVPRDFEDVLEKMASGLLAAEKLVTSVVPLARVVEDGFEELINNRDDHVKILIEPDLAT